MMSLYQYFKPLRTCSELPDPELHPELPDPDGPLSQSLPSSSIRDANNAYLDTSA